MRELLIIGAGPAGTSAALYAKARGIDVAVIEKNKVGGLIGNVSKVSHYTGLVSAETGSTFAARLERQLKDAGIPVLFETVEALELDGEVKRVRTCCGEHEAKAVVLAMGCRPKELPIERKDLILNPAAKALDKVRGRMVVLSGGSDGAAKEALFLAKEAREVHMVQIADRLMMIREFRAEIEASSNIKVHLNTDVESAEGEGLATRVVLFDHARNERVVLEDENGIGLFSYIGQDPNTELVKGALELENGYIVAEGGKTGLEGVFAAGDIVVKGVRQVATAVADGALAGIAAAAYCMG